MKVLEEESRELEGRRKGLEELQEAGRRELDAGREELRLAAEGLEGEKADLKAARKVCRHDSLPISILISHQFAGQLFRMLVLHV